MSTATRFPTPQPTSEPVSALGGTVRIKGKIVSNQDLYLDGEVDGSIELPECNLTIGPTAKVKATIQAQSVVLIGNFEGTIEASERVELRSQCSVVGDVKTTRILIEDGAYYKGSIDIVRPKSTPLEMPRHRSTLD